MLSLCRDVLERCRIRPWAVALALFVLLGAGLRLTWVRDMEYKLDEWWTFTHAQEISRTGVFPVVGMPSSMGVDNPGMGLWIFVVLGKLFHVQQPTDLARAVQALNIAALLLFVLFAARLVPKEEREPWLWTAALLCVHPLSVLFERKIWPPSILLFFVTLLLMCWFGRRRFAAALGWGLVGACLGQIHMGGFFFAAGFVLWALLFDRRNVNWRGWFLGSCLGAIPLVPWLHYVAGALGGLRTQNGKWYHFLECKYWLRWVTEPMGLGLDYALDDSFPDFLRSPYLHGHATYLVGFLHLLMLGIGVWILTRAATTWYRLRGKNMPGRFSSAALTENAALWGYGILLTLSCIPIHRHYMVIAYPLELLWLCRLALRRTAGLAATPRISGRTLLATLCVVQCLVSASFLGYIHTHDSIQGDYGTPYRVQVPDKSEAPNTKSEPDSKSQASNGFAHFGF